MISAPHAVTPTDSRLAKTVDAVVKHAPGLAEERSMRALDLALRIADNEVRLIIEAYSVIEGADGQLWRNVSDRHGNNSAKKQNQVERAVRYIGLRHADAFPWRFIRHPDRPELVRFEDRP